MPSIAETYVSVFPETSKIAAGIKAAFAEVNGKDTGRRLGRELQEGIGTPKFKPEADTAEAEEKLTKTARERKPKIEPDADTKQAEEELAQAARDRSSKIKLDVDKSDLARLDQLVTSGMNKQAAAFEGLLRARRAFNSSDGFKDPLDYSKSILSLRSAEKAFADSMRNDVQSAVSSGGTSGISALSPVLLGVGITMAAGIASALSGLAGLIPAAVGGAGLGIGTLVIGLDGVKDAWDAAGKAAKDSGSDQETKTKAVASATKSLRDAVNDEARAQKDVANARKDARQQLEDLNLELRGGALDETEAVLQAQKAREDLATGMYETSTDYELAQLRVLQADQRVAESHQRNIDMQNNANETRAKGVDGADNVVAANDRLAQTQDRVSEAQQNVTDANAKVSASAQDAAEKMAALSPAGQAVISTLQGMMPQFQAFKFAIQDALLTGIGPQIQQLATTYLPLLQGVMGSMASTMNQAFGSLTQLFQTPEMVAQMQTIFDNISSSFATWSQSITPLVQAFTKISEVGSTFLPQLADGAVKAAQGFANFIDQVSRSGQLQQWIQDGISTMNVLWSVIQTLGSAFMQLAPIGSSVLGALSQILPTLLPSVGPLATAFANMVVALTPTLTMIGQLVSVLLPPLFQMMNNLSGVITTQTGFWTNMNGAITPLNEALGSLISKDAATRSFFDGIKQGIEQVLTPMQALAHVIQDLKDLFSGGSAQRRAQELLDAARNGTTPSLDASGAQVFPGIAGGGGSFAPNGLPGLPTGTLPPPGTPGIPVWVPSGTGGLGTLAIPAGTTRGGWTPAPNPFASTPSASVPGAPSGYSMPTGAAPSDSALLAGVPAGSYSEPGSGAWDLTKGLGDCSSAVEDLVNIMQGRPTAGRSMATGNADEWLTAHGFQPGEGGPGDFRVGFNNHHMQATLPGGTPFNWGSDSAAARGGVGGTGAFDPSFTDHYYLPGNGAAGGPASAKGGPGMPGVPTGAPADPMYIALSPNIPANQKAGAKGSDSGGNQLGQDILGGMGEIFGLDGSVFKDPTQFGLFKIFKGLMGLKFAEDGQGTGGSGGGGGGLFGGGGGGGGGLGGILSMVPQAFGSLKVGSPQDAPGQFMPMNNGSSGTGGIVLNPFAPPGTAGPGNQQQQAGGVNINMQGSNFGHSPTVVQDQIQQSQLPAVRVGTLHGPASG